MTCDLDGIVFSELNPPMTHPGPTKFGEDRHLNTWEECGDNQANKQTNVTRIIAYIRVYGCGHIGVDYSGIWCTFLGAREYLKSNIRLRSHRSRLFGYTVYVFEGTRILEIKH